MNKMTKDIRLDKIKSRNGVKINDLLYMFEMFFRGCSYLKIEKINFETYMVIMIKDGKYSSYTWQL